MNIYIYSCTIKLCFCFRKYVQGDFLLIDPRSPSINIRQPACRIHTAPLSSSNMNSINSLFTHERFSDHLVLLGYENGVIRQFDMRKPDVQLGSVVDP